MKDPISTILFLMLLVVIQIPPAMAQDKKNNNNISKKECNALASLINQRLSYMKDVAAYKWVNQIPIEDLEREKVVIESSLKSAEAYQLDGASSQAFFETQIKLAKLIQQYWFDKWEKKGFEEYPFADLTTEIRPALIQLGDDILKALKDFSPWKYSERQFPQMRSVFFKTIKMKGLSAKEEKELWEAIQLIRPID